MIKIKESFSSELPSWLVRDKYLNNYLSKRGIDLHNATYVPDRMISSGRDKRLKDSNKLQIFRVNHVAYILGVNNPMINIGDRWAEASKFPMRDIVANAEEYGYIDLSDASNTNTDIRKQRADAKKGSVERGIGQYKSKKYKRDGSNGYVDDGYEWVTYKGQDKSGYALPDPDKYVKMLNQVDKSNYGKRVEKVYNKILDIRSRINDLDIESTNGNALNNCYRYLSDIIRNYKELLDRCEKYSSDEYSGDWYFSEKSRFTSFANDVADIEDYIKRVKDILSKVNDGTYDDWL